MITYLTQLPFLNYLIFSIIIWITILILKKNIKNKIILLIEIFYILTAVIILFYPENILISNGINTSYFQILPFKTIKEYITNKSYFTLVSNIFILFPIPIFLFIHKITLKKNMAISFLIAVAIEPIQLLINIITKYPNKIIDIDDFILYIIGVLISLIILFISKKITYKYSSNPKYNYPQSVHTNNGGDNLNKDKEMELNKKKSLEKFNTATKSVKPVNQNQTHNPRPESIEPKIRQV